MSFVKVTNNYQDFKAPPSTSMAMVSLTTAQTALGLTIPATFNYVRIQIQANPARVTYDGTTPAATVGESLPVLTTLVMSANNFATSKWIQEGAGAVTVFVQPFAF